MLRTRVDVFDESGREGDRTARVRQLAERVLAGEGIDRTGVLTVVLVDDDRIRQLNRDFLNRDRVTDVIAFPMEDEMDEVWGEVYVSLDRAEEQAGVYCVAPEKEAARLVIHGVLHLSGYDDQNSTDREKMTLREDYYLAMTED